MWWITYLSTSAAKTHIKFTDLSSHLYCNIRVGWVPDLKVFLGLTSTHNQLLSRWGSCFFSHLYFCYRSVLSHVTCIMHQSMRVSYNRTYVGTDIELLQILPPFLSTFCLQCIGVYLLIWCSAFLAILKSLHKSCMKCSHWLCFILFRIWLECLNGDCGSGCCECCTLWKLH